MIDRFVGFVPCLPPGVHPGMDALAEGLRAALREAGLSLVIESADLRDDEPTVGQGRAIEALVERGASAIVLFAVCLVEPAQAVAASRTAGVPVVTIHHSAMPVDASLIVPNFAHGVAVAAALRDGLTYSTPTVPPAFPRIGVVGPPDILDDLEFIHGVLLGLDQTGLQACNDPLDPRYRNLADVAGEGTNAVEALLDDHDKLDGLVVFNDETLRDALPLLEARGLLGRLPVVSRNGSPEIVAAVTRGEVHATFDYQLPELGHAAGGLVLGVLRGEVATGHAEAAPVGRLITRDTAGSYRPWSERVVPAGLIGTGGVS
ncbi:MAG: sugar ABC transporter substrate-binding protein [Phycisphaeraceae bacterium]